MVVRITKKYDFQKGVVDIFSSSFFVSRNNQLLKWKGDKKMDWIDIEGIVIIGLLIFALILFVRESIELFRNTWWGDDMDGL